MLYSYVRLPIVCCGVVVLLISYPCIPWRKLFTNVEKSICRLYRYVVDFNFVCGMFLVCLVYLCLYQIKMSIMHMLVIWCVCLYIPGLPYRVSWTTSYQVIQNILKYGHVGTRSRANYCVIKKALVRLSTYSTRTVLCDSVFSATRCYRC